MLFVRFKAEELKKQEKKVNIAKNWVLWFTFHKKCVILHLGG